jgi:hypothetical protein
MDHWRLDPPGGMDWRPLERGGTLARAWSPTTPELGSSPARVRREEGKTVKPARRSPGSIGGVMAEQRWQIGGG